MNLENFYTSHKMNCKNNMIKYIHFIPTDAICFDVGSNMGMYSESLLEIRPDSTIHLFEPVKKYYDMSVLKLEKYKNRVIINNFGLSDKEESKEIFLDNMNNPGWNTYISEQTTPTMNIEKTKLSTLDYYCTKNYIKKIDFIKIDTEGYEAFVLSGFINTLKLLEKKPILFIELAWGNKHPNWKFSLIIFEELKKMGYTFTDIELIDRTTDILFIPEKICDI